MRFWLTVTPQLPPEAYAAAQAKGRERFQSFLEALAQRLERGKSLLREIPEDINGSISQRANDGEDGKLSATPGDKRI